MTMPSFTGAEPLIPSRSLREAIGWRLVAEFHRRHPAPWTVIECHPGGGQYDCLTLYHQQVKAFLNREGGFTVFDGEAGKDERIEFENLWPLCLTEGGLRTVLDEMSRLCRLSAPAKLPPTGRETLAYRVMAGVIGSLCFEKETWEWRNGQEDTSGYGCQELRDGWFELFPGAKETARHSWPDDPYNQAKYRFWFLLKDGRPVLCLDKAAHCWSDSGQSDLFSIYSQKHRSLPAVAGYALSQIASYST
jgi:hypothetical protein